MRLDVIARVRGFPARRIDDLIGYQDIAERLTAAALGVAGGRA